MISPTPIKSCDLSPRTGAGWRQLESAHDLYAAVYRENPGGVRLVFQDQYLRGSEISNTALFRYFIADYLLMLVAFRVMGTFHLESVATEDPSACFQQFPGPVHSALRGGDPYTGIRTVPHRATSGTRTRTVRWKSTGNLPRQNGSKFNLLNTLRFLGINYTELLSR